LSYLLRPRHKESDVVKLTVHVNSDYTNKYNVILLDAHPSFIFYGTGNRVFSECLLVCDYITSGTRQRALCRVFFLYFSKMFGVCRFNTRQTLCRAHDRKHSAKSSLSSKFLPCDLCRILLPSVFGFLLSVLGARQISSLFLVVTDALLFEITTAKKVSKSINQG